MSKPGRNDPCPCGSGKKYKKCCEAKEHAETQERMATQRWQQAEYATALAEAQELDRQSNAVLELIERGRLDEAQVAAQRLLINYPQVVDGHERLALVLEARGDWAEAVDQYRQAVAFLDANPDQPSDGFREHCLERITSLRRKLGTPESGQDVPD